MSNPPVPVFRRKGAGRPAKGTGEKRPVGRPAGEAAIMAGYRSQLLADSTGSEVLNRIVKIALDDKHKDQAAMLKFLGERLLPASSFDRAGQARGAVTVTVTTDDGTTVTVQGGGAEEEPETLEAEDAVIVRTNDADGGGDDGGA